MQISDIIWLRQFVEKLETKHGVSQWEVEEILYDRTPVRRIGRGQVEGEDVYEALGQTTDGRYLVVFFIAKGDHPLVISA
ncbi:MAG: BrnT family toxin [Caldilineaceae bacterium]|nr:BrnT family toxin [Caldilineaceae bacterium]